MYKNDQTYFKNIAVRTPEDFQNLFGHFFVWLFMKGGAQIPSEAEG